eukprot:SAG22_NODE_988_length_6140_cov_4.271313_2_plen_131_part_00
MSRAAAAEEAEEEEAGSGRVSQAAVAAWLGSNEAIQMMLGIDRPDSPGAINGVLADIFEGAAATGAPPGRGVSEAEFAAFMRGRMGRAAGGGGGGGGPAGLVPVSAAPSPVPSAGDAFSAAAGSLSSLAR